MRIQEAIKWAVAQLQEHNICDTPLLDASLLLMYVTHLSREELYTHYDDFLSENEYQQFQSLIASRLEHIPIAYLTKVKEFYGRDFHITPDVLIPRGDTETLIEANLIHLATLEHEHTLLDLCTGSGCIGITISLESTSTHVTLSDISEKALLVAKTNCSKLQSPITEIVQSDLFEAFEGRCFHYIVSNPPYIAPSWYQQLSDEVLHEPKLALLSDGDDGLSIIKRIIAQSTLHLYKNGYLMIECDYRQVDDVVSYFKEYGFKEVTYYTDLGMRRRAVSGRYRCTKN